MVTQTVIALTPAKITLALLTLLALTGCTGEPTRQTPATVTLLVGTYTGAADDPDVNPSQGIYSLQLNPETEQLQKPRLLAELDNPSYLAVDSGSQRLYAVSEVGQGEVAAYAWTADGALRLINRVTAGGASPCYLALSPSGRQLAVANYSTGDIAVFDLDQATGAIGEDLQQRRHTGRGPNPKRQESPHAHWVQWDPKGEFLYAVDLGIDKVIGYPVDRATGALGDAFAALETAPGAGPRHMAFHPRQPLVYVLNELDNSLLLAGRNPDGSFTPLQRVETLPEDFSGHSQAAHIAIDADGSRLYVSNRGHNSIAVFDISAGGKLGVPRWASTGGDWPRHFSLLPEQALVAVANQNSHQVQLLRLDSEGYLEPLGEHVRVAQPTFVAPAELPSL